MRGASIYPAFCASPSPSPPPTSLDVRYAHHTQVLPQHTQTVSINLGMSSALPPLVQACSGALASASANAISYPLDLVATRVQTTRHPHLRNSKGPLCILKHVLRTEGLFGLYDGLLTDTASTFLSNFLYFYFYSVLHALVTRRRAMRHASVPPLATLKKAILSQTAPVLLGVPTELAVGFIAGVTSRAVSTPLSVLTVRLQSILSNDSDDEEEASTIITLDNKREYRRPGLYNVACDVYAEHGLSGFWAGFAPTLPLCLSPALTLLLFQLLNRLHLPFSHPSRSTGPLRAFADGAFANVLALAALYPLLLAKVRVQAWHRSTKTSDMAETSTMLGVWRAACKEPKRGWKGLYDGLAVQIMKGFVNQGVTMMVKQRLEHAIVRMYLARR
ncbi:mitochondrial carrier [Fomitopsis betulina]|nr:mitochondrial carrier [Fomitopsis betulina]